MVGGIRCPECGSRKIAKVLYGLPDFTDELVANLEAGEIVLDGCLINSYPYKYECKGCGIRFDVDSGNKDNDGDDIDGCGGELLQR